MKQNLKLRIDNDFLETSESKSSEGSTLETLLTVMPSPEVEKEYNAVFFPPRKTPVRGFHTTRLHYVELAKQAAEIAGYLNMAFCQLRYAFSESSYIATLNHGTVNDLTSVFTENLYKETSKTFETQLRNYITGLNSGKSHIIRPSAKFKGGFDVLYSGLPYTTPASYSAVINKYEIPDNSYRETLHSWFKVAKESNIGQDILTVAKEFHAALFEDTSTYGKAMSTSRHLIQVPLDTNFKDIVKNLEQSPLLAKYGITFNLHEKMPNVDRNLVLALGKYFSFLFVIDPSNTALSHKMRKPDLPSENLDVNEESLLLSPYLGVSLVMHIPEEMAEFITQTPKGGKISLSSLNTWVSVWSRGLFRIPKTKGGISIKQIPKYILKPSIAAKISEKRKTLGFLSESTRANADGIFIANNGSFNFCPSAEELTQENALQYEAIVEKALELSFEAGSPLMISQQGETHKVFSLENPEYAKNIQDLKDKLKKFSGAFQLFNWDYNCILTSSVSEPDKLISVNLAGAARPDELNIADYLRKPFHEAMAKLFPQSMTLDNQRVDKSLFGETTGVATGMVDTSIIQNTLRLYSYMLVEGVVPGFESLVKEAAKELDITSLDDERVDKYEAGLYTGIIENNLKIVPSSLRTDVKVVGAEAQEESKAFISAMSKILYNVLKDSSGIRGTNLSREVVRQNIELEDDPHFFDPSHHNLGNFSNVYNYFGGMLFFVMLRHLSKVERKKLMTSNVDNPLRPVNFLSIVNEVMPFVIMLSKYVPDKENIYEVADELIQRNKKNTSISVDDIKVPGSAEGFQLFPHQVETHQYLRAHPRFAFLDIAPGGGKTALGLTDIAALVGEGLIKRPLIIAPNNLVRNWIEDMHKFTQGKWNLIPITTATYRSWGNERLTKLIKEAPRNTIVVVGSSVLRLDRYPIVIGNHVELVSDTLEFVKKFGFDYVILDESHRVRNQRTSVHKSVKQLCNLTTVKYVRLATGSIIFNKLTDVCGQAAMFSSQIFRTAEEYEAENSEPAGDGSKVMVWKKDTPQRARAKLAEYSAVISFKRKEWAFMLPIPVESFIPVRLEKPESEGGNVHQLMYNAILEETLEEIKKDPRIRELMGGKDEDSGDDDDDDDTDTTPPADLDDATLTELEAALEPYLARLEQLLTDPLGDPFGEIYFTGLQRKNFVSNKVLEIIKRIRLNFTEIPWEKGKTYKVRDEVDYKGQRYVLMPSDKMDYSESYQSKLPPPDDKRWKPQNKGKVIVFCRYTRSVNAIYNALPPDLKKIAVKFTGQVKDKYDQLNAFKSNPYSTTKGAQILIANEQAISEGHNLQMASRLIRAESPWAPGELDQAASRIFRPDPSGENSRENIYLDWILTNGTMEVAKMGRLISKMISKAQFDEAGNHAYYGEVLDLQLPLIRMSLETIASVPTLNDIDEYIQGYRALVAGQSREFREMRETRISKMLDVEPTEMFEDAAILDHVPYLPDLNVPDRHNLDLLKINSYLEDTENPDVAAIIEDPKKLVGRYVHTEFGNGVIINIGQSRPNGDAARKITRIDVQLASGDKYSAAPSMVFLANNVTEANVRDFTPKSPWATKADKKRAERLARMAQRQAERDARKAERDRKREQKALERQQAKEGKKQQQVPKVPTGKQQKQVQAYEVELYPVIYNGMLALEAVTDHEKILKPYGFKSFSDYAYIQVKDYKNFTAILNFLEKKFAITSQTMKRLDRLHDSFKTRGNKKFDVTLATPSEIANFFKIRHKISGIDKATKKPELKVFPVILGETLLLTVDIPTNPVIKKYINKPIPGALTRFDDASGLDIAFFNNRNELVRTVKDMKKDGINIVNFDDLKGEVDELAKKLKVLGSK